MNNILKVISAILILAFAVSNSFGFQELVEYTDFDYGYSFKFPPDWKLKKTPEKSDLGETRVAVQGTEGAVMVTVSKLETSVEKEKYDSNPNSDLLASQLMNWTVEQVYKKSSRQLNASKMMVTEKKTIPCDLGIKYYISSVHFVENNVAITMSGIHVIPFGKPYLISFMMTIFLDSKTKKMTGFFDDIFNSFHLTNEKHPK